MRAFTTGDVQAAQAFEELYRRHFHTLVRLFSVKLLSTAAAEDLAQEVFCRIFTKSKACPSPVSAPGTFRAWMWTIAKNAALDYRRRQPFREMEPLSAQCIRSLRAFVRGATQFMQSLLGRRLAALINRLKTSPQNCRSIFESWFFLHGDHPPRILATATVRFGQGFGKVCYGLAVA